MIASFWPLFVVPVVVIVVVALLIGWRRQEGFGRDVEAERGIGAVRRLYFYFGTFAYLLVAGNGVVLVGRYILDEVFGPARLTRDPGELALGVALALIWTPVWVWHRRRVLRFAQEEPAERRSLLRKLAAYLTLAVTIALATHGAVELLRMVLGSRGFSGYPIAALAVWGSAWLYHWLEEEREGHETDETRTVRRLYVYGVSAYTLATLSAGVAVVLYHIFRDAYEGLFDVPRLLRGEEGLTGDEMKDALGLALPAALLWGYHWLVVARRDVESDIRQFYLFAFVILGGAVAVLSATGVLTFGVLQWAMGTPEHDAASAHFRFLPGVLASIIAGSGIWLYHWDVVRRERASYGRLAEAVRLHGYLLSALGLGALAGAVALLVPTTIAIAVSSARETLVGDDWWRDRIAVVLTLLALGAPVWGYYWSSMQRRVRDGGAEERLALPRRLLLYAVVAAGALAALGSVSHLLYLLLNTALEEGVSLEMLREGKWSIGSLATAALIAPYYWLVLLEDRRRLAEEAPAAAPARRKTVTVLVADGGGALVASLEALLNTKVTVLQRADPGATVPELTPEALARLGRSVAEAPGDRVLLVAENGGVRVYSYS